MAKEVVVFIQRCCLIICSGSMAVCGFPSLSKYTCLYLVFQATTEIFDVIVCCGLSVYLLLEQRAGWRAGFRALGGMWQSRELVKQ